MGHAIPAAVIALCCLVSLQVISSRVSRLPPTRHERPQLGAATALPPRTFLWRRAPGALPEPDERRFARGVCEPWAAWRSDPVRRDAVRERAAAVAADMGVVNSERLTARTVVSVVPPRPEMPKVLCAGFANGANFGRIFTAYRAWAADGCDMVRLFTASPDRLATAAMAQEGGIGSALPAATVVALDVAGDDTYQNQWRRVQSAIRHLARARSAGGHAMLSSVDYVVFFQEDTWVYTHNLRRMLLEPQFRGPHGGGAPLFLGHRFVSGLGEFFPGGGTFVLNAAAVRLADLQIRPTPGVAQSACDVSARTDQADLYLGQCLARLGVRVTDTYDETGADRFFIWAPSVQAGVIGAHPDADWFMQYRRRAMPRNLTAASTHAVLWKGVEPNAMLALAGSTLIGRS